VRGDRGSATVWSLGLVVALLAVFAAVLAMERAVIARHRAGGAADLASLAAADHALDGEQAACGLAVRVARAQGAELTFCRLTGEVADVVAAVGGARVPSRAGPSLAAGTAADALLRPARLRGTLELAVPGVPGNGGRPAGAPGVAGGAGALPVPVGRGGARGSTVGAVGAARPAALVGDGARGGGVVLEQQRGEGTCGVVE